MKLRINGNSVRLRLSPDDLEQFSKEGYLENSTAFVSNVLIYALQSRSDEYGHELSADFRKGILTIYIPERLAKEWISSDIAGFETWMDVDNGEKLCIQIEKDAREVHSLGTEKSHLHNPLAFRHN